MSDIYFNDRKGQTVLSLDEKNGLLFDHITNIHELDEVEQANVQSGLVWLGSYKGEFLNESFWRKLHKKLFGEVWKWAGEYRKSEKNIGIVYYKIPGEMNKLEDDLKYWVQHQSYTPAETIAHFHHRLVAVHPFPNGNGRFARILTNYLCEKLRWPKPNWRNDLAPSLRRKTYIEALRQADLRRFDSLVDFMKHTKEQKEQ